MKKPVVIFDIDGTLTQGDDADGELFFSTICDLLGITEVNRDPSTYADVTDTGIVYDIFMNNMGRPPLRDELQDLENEFALRLKKVVGLSINYKEMAGAIAFVKQLESAGVDLGVATGNWGKSAEIKLRCLGLERLLPKASTSSDAKARKDILRLAANMHTDTEVRAKWYIGDGAWDVQCAKELDFRFIGVGQKLRNFDLLHWTEDFHAQDLLLEKILVLA